MTLVISSTYSVLCSLLRLIKAKTPRLRIQPSEPHTNTYHSSQLIGYFITFHSMFSRLPAYTQFVPGHSPIQSYHPLISAKHLLPLVLDSTQNSEGFPPHLFHPDYIEILLWVLFTPPRQRLCSLESSVPQRSDEQEGRTARYLASV